MWLKMTVIYLTSLHLGVLCPHLSKRSLLTTVPSETSRRCCEPQGFPFTLTSPPGTVEICGHRQPASPSVPAVPPWCWAQPSTAQGCWAFFQSAAIAPAAFCYLLLQCTHTRTEEKSFYPPSSISSSPQTHTSLYPLAPSLALSFLNKLHRLVLALLWPLSLPTFPSGTFLAAQSHQETLAHTHFLAKKMYEWINKWFKGMWAVRKLPIALWCLPACS